MTCNLNIVKNFRISRTLFTKEDGSPTLFYMANPSESLKEIVEKGGGILVDDEEEEDCVKLCENRNDPEIQKDFLPLSYIKHCVMKNQLMDMNIYRENYLNQASPALRKDHESQGTYSNDEVEWQELSKPNHILCPPVMGRKKYTVDEDLKIIQYLIKHNGHRKIGGNKVWRQMETLQITGHSYQSMKDRYQKCILPTIHQYNIPPSWAEKLSRKNPPWMSSDDVESASEEDEDERRQKMNDEDVEQRTKGLTPSGNRSDTDACCISPVLYHHQQNSSGSNGTAMDPDKISSLKRRLPAVDESNPGPSSPKRTPKRTSTVTSSPRSPDESSEEGRTLQPLAIAAGASSPQDDSGSSTSRVESSNSDSNDGKAYKYGNYLGALTEKVLSQSRETERRRVGNGKGEAEEERESSSGDSGGRKKAGCGVRCASKQLTQRRIEAIMEQYDITKEEAAYVFLQYPNKFWPVS